jgi:hypothetical protein
MLLALEGEEACGKTTLAYTAPRPIVGFAFDMGIERALHGAKYELFSDAKIQTKPYDETASAAPDWSGYDITIYELPQPIQLDTVVIQGQEGLWAYFIQLVAAAFRDDSIRTIVIDTMTVARRVKADAYLEMLQGRAGPNEKVRERLLQIEYGATNDAIRNLYTTAAGTKKNLVGVHHLTDERKETIDGKGQIVQALTGNRILEGLAQTYRYMDIALRLKVDKGTVSAEFTKCGYNLALQGLPLLNPTWDTVVQMVEDSLGGRIKLEKCNGTEL